MKFRSSILVAALAGAGMQATQAFAPLASSKARRTAIVSANNALHMVATVTEILDGEVRPRKTREVSIKFSSNILSIHDSSLLTGWLRLVL